MQVFDGGVSRTEGEGASFTKPKNKEWKSSRARKGNRIRCCEALEKGSLGGWERCGVVIQPGDSGHSRGPMGDCRVLLNERKGSLRIIWLSSGAKGQVVVLMEGVLFFQATRVSGLWGLFWALQQGAETAGPCLLHPVELISFL